MHKALWKMVKDSNMCAHTHTHACTSSIYAHTKAHIHIMFHRPVFFPGGSDGKASVYNVRDQGSIPGLGRFPGEGHGYLLHLSSILAWRIPWTV